MDSTRPSAHEASRALQSLLAAALTSSTNNAGSSPGAGAAQGTVSSPATQQPPVRPADRNNKTHAKPNDSRNASVGAGASSTRRTATRQEQPVPEPHLLQAFNEALAAHDQTNRSSPGSSVPQDPYSFAGLQHSHTLALLASQPNLFSGFTLGPLSPRTRNGVGSTSATSNSPHHSHGSPHHHHHDQQTYVPQPTRSGRVPQIPDPMAPDADRDTLLFNDYFDWPSSDDEDDPDFRPDLMNGAAQESSRDGVEKRGGGEGSSVGGGTPWSDIVVGDSGFFSPPEFDDDDDDDYATDFSAVDEGFTPGEGILEEALMLRTMGSDDILAGLGAPGGSNTSSRIPMDPMAQSRMSAPGPGGDGAAAAAAEPPGSRSIRRSPRGKSWNGILSSSSPAANDLASPRSTRDRGGPPKSRSSGSGTGNSTGSGSRSGSALALISSSGTATTSTVALDGSRKRTRGMTRSTRDQQKRQQQQGPLPALPEEEDDDDDEDDDDEYGGNDNTMNEPNRENRQLGGSSIMSRDGNEATRDWLVNRGTENVLDGNLNERRSADDPSGRAVPVPVPVTVPQLPPFDLSAMLAAAAVALQQSSTAKSDLQVHDVSSAQTSANHRRREDGEHAPDEDDSVQSHDEEEQHTSRARPSKKQKASKASTGTDKSKTAKDKTGKGTRGPYRKTVEAGAVPGTQAYADQRKLKQREYQQALRDRQKVAQEETVAKMERLESDNRALVKRVNELEVLLGLTDPSGQAGAGGTAGLGSSSWNRTGGDRSGGDALASNGASHDWNPPRSQQARQYNPPQQQQQSASAQGSSGLLPFDLSNMNSQHVEDFRKLLNWVASAAAAQQQQQQQRS